VIQIYCDFSGYSDIAIGAARVMGFNLMNNFSLPLFSKTMGEFWNRWHISLSSWLRDYLFNPIVIAKRDWGKSAVIYATIITFLVSGIWHGAGWNYLVWGLLHGVILSAEIILGIKSSSLRKKSFKKYFGILVTFNLFAFTEIFFRARSIHQAFAIVKGIFTPHFFFNLKINDTGIFASMIFGVIILFLLEYFIFRNRSFELLETQKPKLLFAMNAFLIILILLFGVSNGEQFIYFQF
jgi:D-alanyl-lipoteichoic acid acyltransferase DltB (MBOAT superfamily)